MRNFVDASGHTHPVAYLDGALLAEPLLEGVFIGVERGPEGQWHAFFQPQDLAYTQQLDYRHWLRCAVAYCQHILDTGRFHGLSVQGRPVVGMA